MKNTSFRKKNSSLPEAELSKVLHLLLIVMAVLFASCNSAEKPRKPIRAADTEATAAVQQAHEGGPAQIEVKELMEDFIPKGWKVIAHAGGDLNGDGINDGAIVIEDTDPGNFKRQDGMGVDTLNLNPRTLMVFLKQENGYQLISQNDKGFIPTANDEDNACLADPLLQDGGISIEKGLLHIDLQYWLSCGSWFVNSATYKFRYQRAGLELIGFDHSEHHRASGEASATSINFSTKKKSITTGGNLFDDQKNQPKTTWSPVKIKRLHRLEACNSDTYSDLLGIGP